MKLIRQFFSDARIQAKYIYAGGDFGDAVSYLYMGECIGFEKLLDKWADWEREYAARGFRTISLDRFVDYGGYNKSLEDILGVRREAEEAPVFHAELYRVHFLHKQIYGEVQEVGEPIEIKGEDGKPKLIVGPAVMGHYALPSTESILKSKKD